MVCLSGVLLASYAFSAGSAVRAQERICQTYPSLFQVFDIERYEKELEREMDEP